MEDKKAEMQVSIEDLAKEIREALDGAKQLNIENTTRRLCIVVTKLEEAPMWAKGQIMEDRDEN